MTDLVSSEKISTDSPSDPEPSLAYSAKRARVECDDNKIGMHVTILSQTLAAQGINAPPRFRASAKDLFSDFVVREIPLDADGVPLTLRVVGSGAQKTPVQTLTRSEKKELKQQEANANAAIIGDPIAKAKLMEEVFSSFTNIIGEEKATAMAEAVASNEETFLVGIVADKAMRGRFHDSVKKIIGNRYVSSAENGQIIISKATAQSKREQEKRSNAGKAPKYLHFTLYKENTDSAAAMRFVANHCGISSRNLFVCGTKDKRAVTLQRVACRGLDPAKLEKINNMFPSKNGLVRIGDFTEKDNGLVLGSLAGNHFTIVLRIVDEDVAINLKNNTYPLDLVQKTLSENGFINYFGPQRFGTTSVLTSDVGMLLLKGMYMEAVVAILSSRVEISPEASSMLEAFKTKPVPDCFVDALAQAPQYCFSERDILKYLVNNYTSFNTPTATADDSKKPSLFSNSPLLEPLYKGALSAIHRNSVMMYFHAVQSFYWNEWVSRRLANKSMKPIVGDMVMLGNEDPLPSGDVDCEATDEGNPAPTTDKYLSNIHYVTAEDVESNRFTMFDVVMTVPGCDSSLKYPLINGFMTKDILMKEISECGAGGLFDPSSDMAKQYHYYGTYRRVLQRLSDFKLSVKTYENPSDVLITTDIQRIKSEGGYVGIYNDKCTSFAPATAAKQGVAVIAEFSLSAGAYATCVLREFCETIRGSEI